MLRFLIAVIAVSAAIVPSAKATNNTTYADFPEAAYTENSVKMYSILPNNDSTAHPDFNQIELPTFAPNDRATQNQSKQNTNPTVAVSEAFKPQSKQILNTPLYNEIAEELERQKKLNAQKIKAPSRTTADLSALLTESDTRKLNLACKMYARTLFSQNTQKMLNELEPKISLSKQSLHTTGVQNSGSAGLITKLFYLIEDIINDVASHKTEVNYKNLSKDHEIKRELEALIIEYGGQLNHTRFLNYINAIYPYQTLENIYGAQPSATPADQDTLPLPEPEDDEQVTFKLKHPHIEEKTKLLNRSRRGWMI